MESLFNTPMGTKGHKPMRVARWYLRLSEFDYRVEYRPGKQNWVADALSRLPIASNGEQLPESWTDHFVAHINVPSALNLTELASNTASDPLLSKICTYLVNGWPAKSGLTRDLRTFFSIRNELCVVEGCLVRGSHALVVPESLQYRVLELAHLGHPGVVRCKQRLQNEYWWPGMGKFVENFVANCVPCQLSDKTAKPATPHIQPVSVPEVPWTKVAFDICGPFATAPATKRFLLVLQDYTSKYPEVGSCGTITSASVMEFLEAVFSRHGYPLEMITDNGTQLVSGEFKSYLRSRGINHSRTAFYNPQANGMVERFNRVLKEGLQAAHIEGMAWDNSIRNLLMTYRSTRHATTGKSPFETMYGVPRQMR
ncbi:MAG: DDE-type integrase/transposase/recombinase, partial [Bacteroidota bacterium]